MVMFLEDPVTGDVPHRGLVEEEDEQRAAEVAPQYTASPEVQVSGAHVHIKPGWQRSLRSGACRPVERTRWCTISSCSQC